MKICTRCRNSKSLDSFSKRVASKDGLLAWCKPCAAQYRKDNRDKINQSQQIYRDENRERVRAWDRSKHRKYRLARYGLTEDEYEQIVMAQDNRCLICGLTPSDKLVVDHCHESGRVRGLLCRKCNTVLGLVDESPYTLEQAIHYLQS